MNKQEVIFQDLGVQDYQSAWDYQEELLKENVKIKSAIGDLQFANSGSDNKTDNYQLPTVHYLLFVQHPPVYTLGKSGKEENLLINDQEEMIRKSDFIKQTVAVI